MKMSKTTEIQTTKPTGDVVLQEMWRIKDKLSAAYANDLEGFFADLRKREKLSGHPLVNLQKRKRTKSPRKSKAEE